MVDPAVALAALRPAERARLERFARVFERVDASRYPQLTETAPSEQVRGAQDRAVDLIGRGSRREAVRAAVAAFVDEGTVTYARRMSLTDTFLLFQSLPDRAEDRVRFLATLERAVVAMILWDELDSEDLAVLIGPWSGLIEALPAG